MPRKPDIPLLSRNPTPAQIADRLNRLIQWAAAIGTGILSEKEVVTAGDLVRARTHTISNKALTQVQPDLVDHTHTESEDGGLIDHGTALLGLADDDHLQYLLLAGRSGGQVVYGGADSGDDLEIHSTSHATKGTVLIGATVDVDEANNTVTLHLGTQDYKLLTCGGNCFTIQAQGAGTEAHLRLMSNDGDGTDDVYQSIHGVGLPTDTTNRERLVYGWDAATGVYRITTEANGTGSARELRMGVAGFYGVASFQTDGSLRVGDVAGSDYTKFEPGTGFNVFAGEARPYDDMQWSISSGKVPAANFPDFDTFTANTREYNFDVDDYVDLETNEPPHKWEEGSDIAMHLHVTVGVANATGSNRYAKFTVYLAYADIDEVWTETSLTAELTIPDGTAAMTATKVSLGNLSIPDNLLGTQIKPSVKRIAATGGTEYPNHIFITQLGGHYISDTGGSREVATK